MLMQNKTRILQNTMDGAMSYLTSQAISVVQQVVPGSRM